MMTLFLPVFETYIVNCLFLTKMQQTKNMDVISVVCHCLHWNDPWLHNCMYESRSKGATFSSGHSFIQFLFSGSPEERRSWT